MRSEFFLWCLWFILWSFSLSLGVNWTLKVRFYTKRQVPHTNRNRVPLDLWLIHTAGEGLRYWLGLGLLSYTELGSRDPSPSLCNVNMLCIVQCSHLESAPESVSFTAETLFYYRPQTKFAKIVFTPVCLSTGGCLARGVSRPTPGGGVQAHTGGGVSQHALRLTPPQQMTAAAGGTHPTGMHSCLLLNKQNVSVQCI